MTPRFIINEVLKSKQFENISYAQEGEDLILNRLIGNQSMGFYIDVGAHHPARFSNTYLFYQKGWRGINIDAMPGSMKSFNELRPRDINLELGIAKARTQLTYYIFNEKALNTFSVDEAKRKDGKNGYRIIEKKLVEVYPLADVLNQYIDENQLIDFMSIDVEGLDMEVLSSNDWDKYRPKFIVLEDLQRLDISSLITNSEIYAKMTSTGYELIAKSYNSLFFKDKLNAR